MMSPEKLKVVYLHPHFTAEGGAGRMVLESGRRLASRGHDVHCVCIRADDAIIGNVRGIITFHEIGGFNDQNCRKVYLGVDLERFTPAPQERQKHPIAVVCKLIRFKNVDRIIEAVAQLSGERCDLHCEIVGTGDALPILKDLSIRLQVESRVTFHGRVGDAGAVALLQRASVFCLASEEEPFGLVLIEAMACGTPVVAMNSGGTKEIIAGHNCGLLVESSSASALADALRQVFTDPAKSQRMSVAAIVRAWQFNWERTVNELEEHLLRLASDPL